jgi:pheromone shutdown protein TraB
MECEREFFEQYLAWSLTRSKAVNGSSIVVGVVGQGHLQGIIREIMHDKGDLRFRDLVGVRESKTVKERAYNFFLESIVGLVLWFVWKYLYANYDVAAFLSNIL